MAEVTTPSKVGGKLETLSKDELLKLIKKQAINTKDLKKRLEDVTAALKSEKVEISRLENEKKNWISHGVSAEFEKKNKITKKDKELELAAQLGKEMLVENDVLQQQLSKVKEEHDTSVREYEDELDRIMQDKVMLEQTLQSMQEEYKNAKQDALDNREVLKCEKEQHKININELHQQIKEYTQQIKELQSKNKTLEDHMSSSNAHVKVKKIKDKLEEVTRENEAHKERNNLLELNCKDRSERMLSLDQDLKRLRKEILGYQKQNKVDQTEINSLNETNESLELTFNESQEKMKELNEYVNMVVSERNESVAYVKQLDDSLLKSKSEKDKVIKTLKTTKTKLERATQMEEELKKQLNVIVGERDELMKKLQKKNTKGKVKGGKAQKEEEAESDVNMQQIKKLQDQVTQLTEENNKLRQTALNMTQTSDGIHESYQNLQKDFDELRFEIDEVTSSKNVLHEEHEKLVTDKNEIDQKFKTLQEVYQSCLLEKDSVVAQKSIIENDLNERKESMEELKTLLEKAIRERDENNVQLENLQTEIKLKETKEETDLKAKENDASIEISTQSRELTELDEETKATIVKLEGRIDELLNQMQRLNEEKLNQDTELEELFKSHDDLLNKYDFECKERERVENENRLLEERISQEGKQKEIEGVKNEPTVEVEEQIKLLEESLKELTMSRDYYQQDADLKEQTMLELRNEIEQMGRRHGEMSIENNKELDKIFSEFQQLDDELQDTRLLLQGVVAEKNALEVVNRDLELEKQYVEEILSNTAQTVEKLEEELNLEKSDYEELQEKYVELQQQQQQQQIETTSQGESEHFQAQLNDKHSYIETLENKLKEVEGVCETIPEKDYKITSLQKEIIELNSHMATLANQSASNETELLNSQQLQEELNTLRQAYNDARTELKALKMTEENYLNESHEKETVVKTLRREIEQLHQVVHDTKNLLQEKEDVKLLENDLEVQKETIEKLTADIRQNTSPEKLNEILNQQNHKICEKDKELSALKMEIDDFKMKYSTLGNTSNELKQQLESSEKQKNDIQKASNELHQQFDEATRNNRSSYEKHVQQMSVSLKALTEEKTTYEGKIETLLKEKSIFEDSISELSKKIETHKSEKFAQDANINELTQRLHALEQETARLTESVSTEQSENVDLRSSLQEKIQLLESLKETLSNETSNSDMIQELEQLKISYSNIEAELQPALNKIEELETSLKQSNEELKEKTEKANKLRNVAIKAKKELGNIRQKFEEEKQSLQQEINLLTTQTASLTVEITQQKTNCSKHEEEFEEMQIEMKRLQDQLTNEQTSTLSKSSETQDLTCKIDTMSATITAYKNQISQLEQANASLETSISELTNDKQVLQDSLDNTKNETEEKLKEAGELKTQIETLQKSLQNAQKDSTQMNVMNLEIDDYLKTIENLNEKLQNKQSHCDQLEQAAQTFTEKQTALQNGLASLKKSRDATEEKSRKMKNLIVKLKKEIEEFKKQDASNKEREKEGKETIEQLSQNIEQLKLDISTLSIEKERLNTNILEKSENHQKAYHAIEVKYARSVNDLSASNKLYEELKEEYENYKVRARNVLKQQKEKSSNTTEEKHTQEIKHLDEQIDRLKEELHNTKEELKTLQDEHDEVEEAYEQQSTVHAEFVKELTQKETGWKTRYKQAKQDSDLKNFQYEEKLKRLMKENTNLLQSSKDRLGSLKIENEGYVEEISLLKDRLQELKTSSSLPEITSSPEIKKFRNQKEAKGSHLSLEFSKYSMERQEGEGMDQTELAIIDTLSERSSLPPTPLSPTAILENALVSEAPKTPLALKDEMMSLKSALNISTKKNEHMTALLRECEANASRLYDQAIVLKEEIRRLERNEKREQETQNMEYLKNVIIKFLKVTSVEREQLIPVLCTMLKLSEEEKTFIKTYAKGDDDTNTDEANSSWSSYMYRWTSLS